MNSLIQVVFVKRELRGIEVAFGVAAVSGACFVMAKTIQIIGKGCGVTLSDTNGVQPHDVLYNGRKPGWKMLLR